jgi:hypothetical protein
LIKKEVKNHQKTPKIQFLGGNSNPIEKGGLFRPPFFHWCLMKSIEKSDPFKSIHLRNARIGGRKMIQKVISNANGKKATGKLPLFFQFNFGVGPQKGLQGGFNF